MAATNYAQLIAWIRSEVGDTAGTSLVGAALSNLIAAETPAGTLDGANNLFTLSNQNIVVGTVGGYNYGPFFTVNTTVRSTSLATVDPISGLLTYGAAPASGASPFSVAYWFQWFTDPIYSQFIDQATMELNQPAGADVGFSLYPALIQYSAERFYTKMASDYARKYASSGGGADEKVQTVTQSYLALAKACRAKADKMRLTGYVDPGARKKAASGTITYGVSPYTPPR